MTKKEFENLIKLLKENFDKFAKEYEENEENLEEMINISETLINKLNEQEKKLNTLIQNKINYFNHLKENKNLLIIEDISNKIENLLKKYDNLLKKEINEFEEQKKEILKLNEKI